jgi:hypothetical protein
MNIAISATFTESVYGNRATGLPAVRQHRLKAIAQEEALWRTESESHDRANAELIPRLVVRVEGLGNVHAKMNAPRV